MGAQDRDAQSRERFVAGRDAYSAGQYDVALERFTEAYDLSPRPQLLYNIGQCHDRLRHDQEAIDSFERYLALVPEADNGEEVRARLQALRRAVHEREEQQAPVATNDEPSSVLRSWWLWTIVGVLVVGAAVTAVVVVTRPDHQLPTGDFGPNGRVAALVSW